MSLQIYNTLSRKKEKFTPIKKGEVGIYVCGPTVYGHAHIGHAKSYVSFDVIVRYLKNSEYKVKYVQNLTDVGHLVGDVDEGEDKIEKQSKIEHKHPMEIAEYYTRSYFEDMDKLNNFRPDISPRASGHITEQIEIIKNLIENNFAYKKNGSVYFDVSKFKNYGKLSNRTIDELTEGTRVKVVKEKNNPADFALWKKAERGHIMQWQSPWGSGYPGWHIECSAMSMKYLGKSFDIHGGGIENQFPHHECEIAQSEASTKKLFVKYWMHNNMVTVDGKKMGKSLGNFTTLKNAFKKFDAMTIRFFILQSHYRSTLDFSEQAIVAAKKGYDKLNNVYKKLKQSSIENKFGEESISIKTYNDDFKSAMDDDFNTPQAIAVLFDLAKGINTILSSDKLLNKKSLNEVLSFFTNNGESILGLFVEDEPKKDNKIESELIELLIETRNQARKLKQFTLSDLIRNKLGEIGIILEDKKEKTEWKKQE
ncbi:MAG: cysteine--tRNA ligase [Bacteroidetes bacterium]|nr:cysteine--tRNA ligase [Bacteroidota bacterium]